MKLTWAVAALMVVGVGCSHMHKHHEEGEEGNEVKMKFSEVPPAVQTALTREANGQTIKTVDKEERDGQIVYETDVKSGGKNGEIVVDGNGNVVSKKEENEAAEKAEKKGKEK